MAKAVTGHLTSGSPDPLDGRMILLQSGGDLRDLSVARLLMLFAQIDDRWAWEITLSGFLTPADGYAPMV